MSLMSIHVTKFNHALFKITICCENLSKTVIHYEARSHSEMTGSEKIVIKQSSVFLNTVN